MIKKYRKRNYKGLILIANYHIQYNKIFKEYNQKNNSKKTNLGQNTILVPNPKIKIQNVLKNHLFYQLINVLFHKLILRVFC